MENANENVKQSDEKPKISSIKCFGKIRIKEKWEYLRNLITIEPVICLLVTAKVLIVPAITNLHFEKACKVNAGFNDTVCEAIVSGTYLKLNFKEENNVVQSFITKTRSWEIPVSSVVPVILILFVGAYSDRHKIRKPFLLMPLLGDMVGLIGTSISIMFMKQWSLEAQVVADKIIPSIFGSDKLIITMTFAYIADISSKEMRILRLAAIPTMLAFLIPILHAVSGIMFRALGYFPVLGISFTFFIAAFTYGVIKVKESVKMKHDKKELIKDIFNYQHMIDTLKFLTEKKENFNRTNFILILLICFILATVQSGEQTTFFLFTQQAYQWTVVDYSYFTTLTAVMKFLGLSVAVPIFAKVFHLSEFIIMIIAYADAIAASSIFLFVRSPLGLYIDTK
ncbi:hypothetical protein FQA39_LY13614 [Lamprigera yunnana]|nr:hypothetical protein FQA39_LY13614 [Lamprigera yunnana]